MNKFDVVDLGTKKGNALQFFFKVVYSHCNAKKKFNPFVGLETSLKELQQKNSIGYERPEAASYRKDVETKGFQFGLLDLSVASDIKKLPLGAFYTAWHFLEHLPDKKTAKVVVQEALSKAEKMLWCRLPSFEQNDETGEGVLRKLGLRFTWTNWKGHPCHWLVADCVEAIESWGAVNPDKPFDLFVKPSSWIESTDHFRVVPIDTPVDVTAYSPKFGKKPFKKFDKPIVAEWEVIARFK